MGPSASRIAKGWGLGRIEEPGFVRKRRSRICKVGRDRSATNLAVNGWSQICENLGQNNASYQWVERGGIAPTFIRSAHIRDLCASIVKLSLTLACASASEAGDLRRHAAQFALRYAQPGGGGASVRFALFGVSALAPVARALPRAEETHTRREGNRGATGPRGLVTRDYFAFVPSPM